MEKTFLSYLQIFDAILWGKILFYLLSGLGLYLTIRLRGVQFRFLTYSLKLAFKPQVKSSAKGDITPFQSLMTTLAATIGIASIAGVSTAIMAGGFGAIFWMWVIALLGMATRFGESLLALKFREVDEKGQMRGGPMYYIEKGLGLKWLAILFALFGTLSAFAGGNLTQAHSIAHALSELGGVPVIATGIILSVVTALVLFGGIQTIGRFCGIFVPIMATLYLLGGLSILAIHIEKIPGAIAMIVKCAFSGQAAVGGFLGASVTAAIQYGMARGVSSNEAGLGSAPIAAAAAKTDSAGNGALISMSGAFLSTFIVCSVTALVLAVTGVVGKTGANGVALVMEAFSSTIPYGKWVVGLGVLLFGYSTIVGWSYYGERCFVYLGGERFLNLYRLLFCSVTLCGTLMSIDIVWPIVDIMNGLMALPNILGLMALSSLIVTESQSYFAKQFN